MRFKAISPLLIFILFTGTISEARAESVSRYLYTSTFKLENRGEAPYTLTDLETTILLFMNNRWQTVIIRNSTHSIEHETFDVDGNRIAELDLPSTLPPGSDMTFSIVYEIESLNQPKQEIDPSEADPFSAIPSELIEEFSVETETFNARDEEIYEMALRLTENETTVLGSVSRLIEWITVNVVYGNFEVPRYPEDTIFHGAGDCDDQSILLITLCRALSIPAFLQVGLIFDDSLEGDVDSWGGHLRISQKGVGWHGWAMIYIPPWGWLPVDLTIRRSHEGLAVIREAPEYGSHIIISFNVSRQEYIGESIISRNQLMESELYVTTYYVGVKEDTSSSTMVQNYLVIAVGSVIATILVILFIRKHRDSNVERY